MAEAITLYEPGADLTGKVVTTPVVGKRFLAITADKQGTLSAASLDKGLDTTASGGTISVTYATAAGRIVGVSRFDAAVGDYVGIARASKTVIPVTTVTSLTAFQEVEVGASGQATAKAAGVAVGYAITSAAAGSDALICLY